MQATNDTFALRKGIFFSLIILFLIGLGFSLKLTELHYRIYTDPTYHSSCAINESFNCETVAGSQYSIVLGAPVAAWGVLGYLIMGLLLFFSRRSKNDFIALALICTASVIVSITMALISLCIICSFCLYCTITYVVNIIMLIIIIVEWRHQRILFKDIFSSPYIFIKNHHFSFILIGLAIALLVFKYPHYWENIMNASIPNGITEDNLSWIGAENGELVIEEMNVNIPNGITEDNLPWIGAENGELVIEEFSDYMCPHCKHGHEYVRGIINKNLDKIKLIHRHFPLDGTCNSLIPPHITAHRGACRLAQAAICAEKFNKFWEMNDLLYEMKALSLESNEIIERAAEKLMINNDEFKKCLDSKETDEHLKNDIQIGLRYNIKATPSFLIEGIVHGGTIPDYVFETFEIEK